jgi:hypothetical protein
MPLSSSSVDRRIPEALGTVLEPEERRREASAAGARRLGTTTELINRISYNPLESFFDKSWRPGEIELVN